MPGNGIYTGGIYRPTSIETWDGDSAGYQWDDLTNWNQTPLLPLTFTTAIVDGGRIDKWLPLTNITATGRVTTTIQYGNTVDSTGGAIDSPSSVTYNPGDSVTPIKARYFKFTFSLDYNDSAGAEETPTLSSVTTNLNAEKVMATFDSIDSSTLSGSAGLRTLVVDQPISPTVVTIQPHLPSSVLDSAGASDLASSFVTDGYVAEGYVDTDFVIDASSGGGSGGSTSRPVVYIDKSGANIVLNIFEFDTFGKTKLVDCTFDAIIQGLPNANVIANGSIARS
jgi:hypothetical protein